MRSLTLDLYIPRGPKPAAPSSVWVLPLYVSRPLLEPEGVVRWARGLGLGPVEPADELHCTVLYSKAPVDWREAGGLYAQERLMVGKGGPRRVLQFGKHIVLAFDSAQLRYRHQEMRRLGASHDFPEYNPHVSVIKLADGAAPPDLSAVEPYDGPLLFGAETFRKVED